MKTQHVIVVGAGMGGLAAALDLVRRGVRVTVLEAAPGPGGKMRVVDGMDAGPTVFTMRWAFDGLFEDCGEVLERHLELEPMEVLARHAWPDGSRLDLFPDVNRSADAIGAFASADDARGYRAFVARAEDIYRTLAQPFIASEKPSSIELVRRVGLGQLEALWRTMPLTTLWDALGGFFKDARLRQLFGRYATYVGSSPMLTPATLMLVAHVERTGLFRVVGGMHRVARVLEALATARGATFRYGARVAQLVVERGHACGVQLDSGERLDGDAIVFNGDVSAIATGCLGPAVTGAARATPREARALSAVTWCARAVTRGFPLAHHNVFFGEHYEDEFDAIFRRREITARPTVYLCAQDRDGTAAPRVAGPERMLMLINAPADGDLKADDPAYLDELRARTLVLLRDCGLEVDQTSLSATATGPAGFEQRFPATGGALYGRANHGFMGTFERPPSVSSTPGLYFVGGSVHPGAGVPMALMSGRLCAARVVEDQFGRAPSTGRFLSVRAG
ncbi:MAG: phytoene desaturase [Myxococcaceae bacterium]|jgi:1-hydroxycarotenoid 3,4-desaturase|nr:phytoene desaturase [Myxococcaceae bacterium]